VKAIGTSLRERAASFWLLVLFWCARYAPLMLRMIKPVALWATWHSSRHIRDATTANARWLVGESSGMSARRAFGKKVLARFFEAVAEFGTNRHLSKQAILQRVEQVFGLERFEEARRFRRGAILVTAHLGSFETAMTMLAEHEPRVHVVFRRDKNRVFESMRSEQRARLGIIEEPADEGLPMWLRVRDAIRADEVVLVQGDRVMPGESGVLVPFMGGHVRVPAGPAKLARATGAPIIPTFAVRSESGRVLIYLEEPIWLETLPDSPGQLDPAVARIALAIESCVQRYPDQWLVLYKAWREDAVDR